MKQLATKKVVVAMSGGIDSAMTALMLKKQGFEVMGIHLLFWFDDQQNSCAEGQKMENKCCSTESLERARRFAKRLKIPFYVMDVKKEFKKKIVDPFLIDYNLGITPNPCVNCNREIKFGWLLKKMAELSASFLATGHYAKIKEINGNYSLCKAKDAKKDQSYFLYTLTQEKLKKILFPLGDYLKSDVTSMAEKEEINELLLINKEKESQDLCFYPEKESKYFLKRHLNLIPGTFRHIETGKIVGIHDGLPLYTIGQRKGVTGGGFVEPQYIIKKDKLKNEIIIGPEKYLEKESFEVKDIHFVSGKTPAKISNFKVKIRYQAPEIEADFLSKRYGKGTIFLKKPQKAITPGQSVVFYQENRVLGGGIID